MGSKEMHKETLMMNQGEHLKKKKNKKKKAGDYLMSRLLYPVFQALAEESEQYGVIQPAR
jgi:hypothetical protein